MKSWLSLVSLLRSRLRFSLHNRQPENALAAKLPHINKQLVELLPPESLIQTQSRARGFNVGDCAVGVRVGETALNE